MKNFYFIIISLLLLTASEQYKFEAITPSHLEEYTYVPNIAHGAQNIILDVENDTDTSLKTALIRECFRHHSIVLLTKDSSPKIITKSSLMKCLKNRSNIVIPIKNLNPKILNNLLLKHIFNSKWSLVYIILATNEDQFKCHNGVFNNETFKIIDVFLNRLWHKHKMIYVIMVFPFVCPDRVIIYDGKKQSNDLLYNRGIRVICVKNYKNLENALKKDEESLMQGYPIRANIFYRFPTAITECSGFEYYIERKDFTGGFCGLDGLIMHDAVEYFKFNLSVPKLQDKNRDTFGYVTSNGTITGSLGHIIRDKTDISFNSRFMVPYSTDGFVFLHYISRDSLCALVKRPEDVPLWHYPYNAYDITLWFLIVVTLMSIGGLMWISALINEKMTKEPASKCFVYVLDSINSGFFGFSIMRNTKFMILRGSCLFCSMVLLATYQGHVNYVFTTLIRYGKINTLLELYELETVIYTSPAIKELLLSPINTLEKSLLNRMQIWPTDNGSSFDFILEHTNTATLQRKSDVILETLKSYTDEEGRPMLYSVEQCFITYYLSYIASEGFPFTEQLKLFMERLNEAGLPEMYYKWTRRALGLVDSLEETKSEPRNASVIKLSEQCIAFCLLMTGYVVSIITFIGEKWWIRKKTQP